MSLKVIVDKKFDLNDDVPGKIEQAIGLGWKNFSILPNGEVVNADIHMKVTLGPVIGEVTQTSAIILVEVEFKDAENPTLQCQLFAKDEPSEPIQVQDLEVTNKRPISFVFEDLTPNTWYQAIFTSVQGPPAVANFKTKVPDDDMKTFKLLAVSCDRYSRLLMGQLDPWKQVKKIVKTGRVDTLLHVGDQIYPNDENMAHAEKIFSGIYDEMPEDKQHEMMLRAHELWRQLYTINFNTKYKKEVLSNTSNVMIWSDNDVANDFTTLKNESGEQAYHPKFLVCGMEAYKDYQRRLWDPQCVAVNEGLVQEWHSHIYGKVGIFMFDLRGNRITADGVQQSDLPLISDEQWAAFEEFMANDQLKAIILCSETPFIGEEPSVCIAKVEASSKCDFLRDHWYFNEQELLKLVEMSFAWKAVDPDLRDIIFVAGDIHCGVTTTLTDEDSGLQINHYTTSPITNHVCDFFPPLTGSLNERFHFNHLPLGKKFRNFLEVDIRFDEECTNIQAKIVPVSTDIFKDHVWED